MTKITPISTLLFTLCAAAFLGTAATAQSEAPPTIESVAWPAFMAKQDMHFTKLPTSWKQAPHFGNGMVGSMLYQAGPPPFPRPPVLPTGYFRASRNKQIPSSQPAILSGVPTWLSEFGAQRLI